MTPKPQAKYLPIRSSITRKSGDSNEIGMRSVPTYPTSPRVLRTFIEMKEKAKFESQPELLESTFTVSKVGRMPMKKKDVSMPLFDSGEFNLATTKRQTCDASSQTNFEEYKTAEEILIAQ